MALHYLKVAYKQSEADFLQSDSDSTNRKGFKLKEGRFILNIRRDFFFFFFTQRVVWHWQRLHRKVVDAPSLVMFKARSNLVDGNAAHSEG